MEQEQTKSNLEKQEELLKFFVKKGFLLDNKILEFFSKINNKEFCEGILEKLLLISKARVITKALLVTHFNEIKPLLSGLGPEERKIIDKFIQSVPKEDLEAREREREKEKEQKEKDKEKEETVDVKILSSNIIPYKKITVKDFTTHFKNRYCFFRDILKEKSELNNLISIDKIGNNRDFSIIGLVSSKRITKNKNILIEVEDLTGKIIALVNQNKEEIFKKAEEILLDDVVALKCSGVGGRDIVYVNDIFFPDSGLPEKRKLSQEAYAVFISDIHLGSSNFLEKNFDKFIDWLNGKGCTGEQKEKVKKIKYVFIVGDSIDGVGVFPGQEDQIIIKDVREQYNKLASYLKRIPKEINIILCPGQHDAVRVPEPQPPLDEEFAQALIDLKNVILVSNPSLIEVGASNKSSGLKILMYHGASMHSWIESIEELRTINAHHCPARVVKHILKHRHLSPTHSGTTYVPDEKEDKLIINEVPDIIATGDLHKPDIDMYNNILIVCSSCWQSMTPFEEKVGNQPDPCKVPLLNLKTREIKILDFSDEPENETQPHEIEEEH